MLRWKVCGITNREDATIAVEAGADALGFIFYSPSPRSICEAEAASISAALPAETWRIGVFVDTPAVEMQRIIDRVGLDFVQLSGDESPEVCTVLERHAIKALRFDDDVTPAAAAAAAAAAAYYPDCSLLIDAGDSAEYGGSGRRSNWAAAAALAKAQRIILAGGLTPANVVSAIEEVKPWAVDVASGVESSPGRKDAGKLRAFAAALRPYR